MQRRLLLFCLVLSGAAGLSYELLWIRLLTLSFGSTTLSFSTVLAVFFGGLALGSWLVTKLFDRISDPLRAYAIIELAMGALGLLLYPLLSSLGPLFARIDPGQGLAAALVRLACAAPLLLVPTVLMGATLPLASKALIRSDREVGRDTSLIYGANTLGAFLGAYVVTYHGLYEFGVWGTHLCTASLNALVAVIALRARRGVLAPSMPPPEPASAASPPPRSGFIATAGLITFLAGFSFVCFEVVWARVISVFLRGTIYGVGAVLLCFLFGIALGSGVIARWSDRVDSARWFSGLQGLTGIGVVLVSLLMPRVRYELEVLSASGLQGLWPLHLQLALVFATLLIPTAAAGASFPLLVRAVTQVAESAGRNLGVIYALNTLGTILASLVVGFLVIPTLGSEAALFLGLLTTSATAGLSAVLLARSTNLTLRLILAGLALVPLVTFPGLDLPRLLASGDARLNYRGFRQSVEANVHKVRRFREGLSSVVEVIETAPGSMGLSLSGLGQGTIHQVPPQYPIESTLLATVPLSHRPTPKRTLVVGFGAGATVQIMSELGLPEVTVLELEREVLESADLLFAGRSPLRNPRVHALVGDARHFLLVSRARDEAPYDLIASMPSHPWVAASLFTREFFELARDSLSADGVFVTWFGTGSLDSAAAESMVRAFASAFSHYALYHVPEVSAYYIAGSRAPLSFDLDSARALGRHRAIASHALLRDPMFLPARLTTSSWSPAPTLAQGPINTDDSAFVELHGPRSSTRSAGSSELTQPGVFPGDAVTPPGAPFHLELIEYLLGTPGGQLPSRASRPNSRRAHAALAKAKASLGESEFAYLAGRVQLAEGRLSEALSHLRAGTSAPEPVGSRARKFQLFATPGSARATPELWAQLPPSDDVILHLTEVHPQLASERLRENAATGEVQWLLRAFAGLEPDAVTREGLGRIRELTRTQLMGTNWLASLERCIAFALAHDVEDLAASCRAEAQRVRSERAARSFGRAQSHARRGEWSAARSSLRAAFELAPGRRDILEALLEVELSVGDLSSLGELRDLSRLSVPPEVFEALREQILARRAGAANP